MKLLLNIIFERLHRYVFDYQHQSTNPDFGLPTKYVAANRHNKLERYNPLVSKYYDKLCPYFIGWRESIVKKYPNKPKYQRYK
mgnify:CR=1 FL=1